MLKKLTLALAALFLISFMANVCAAKNSRAKDRDYYKNTITAARETIWKAITDGHGSCASVAVMDEGRLVYSECFGAADRAANRPVDKNTRFNIGSTSKMFGAVAILLLVDEGKVSLDEKIVKYIPEFQMKDERYKDITVRMIFNHSSGLPGSSFFFGYAKYNQMHKLLLDTLKDASLKHAPGEMSMYCNDGFTLAEIIVEKVSGKKFMDFLAERVFKPLGMKNTGVSVGECGLENIAEYYDVKTGKKYPPELVEIYACGGISSTAEDLCKFGNSFNPKSGRKILSAASLGEIRKNQPYLYYDKLRHRPMMSEFGWEYSNIDELEAKGIQALGKGGNTMCYSANLQIAPDHGISIGVLINGHISGELLTRPVLDALLKDKNLMDAPKDAAKKPVEAQKVPEELLKFAGIYAKDMGPFKVVFNKNNDGLEMIPLQPVKSEKTPDGKPADSDKNKKDDKDDKTPAEGAIAFTYNGGVFHNFEKDEKCYFTEIDGRQYIVAHKVKTYGVDYIQMQKLDELKNPVSFKIDMIDKIWLVRNEKPYILAGSINTAKVEFYKELPGYADFSGIKKIETPDYASITGKIFRDQAEMRLVDMNGETWIKSNYGLCSPADSARKLASGVNRVIIKSEGFNEWLKAEKGAIVKFEKPMNGRVIVLDEEKAIYDSVADKDEVYVPEKGFIFLAGEPGDVFKVTAR